MTLPAIGSYSSKAIGGKAFAANKNQRLEIEEGPGKKLKAFIRDHHPLESELLQADPAVNESFNPRLQKATPVMRDQIEVGEVRFSLQSQGLEPWKPLDHSLWADRIAIPYEHSLPTKPLYSVPRFAHQRHCVSVLVRRHRVEYVLYYLVWKVIHPSFFTIQSTTFPGKNAKGSKENRTKKKSTFRENFGIKQNKTKKGASLAYAYT